jgi:hypothetical protein
MRPIVHSIFNVHDDYRPRPVVSRVSTSPPTVIKTVTKDAIEEDILESVPKTIDLGVLFV